jgi:hypothetical protein
MKLSKSQMRLLDELQNGKKSAVVINAETIPVIQAWTGNSFESVGAQWYLNDIPMSHGDEVRNYNGKFEAWGMRRLNAGS